MASVSEKIQLNISFNRNRKDPVLEKSYQQLYYTSPVQRQARDVDYLASKSEKELSDIETFRCITPGTEYGFIQHVTPPPSPSRVFYEFEDESPVSPKTVKDKRMVRTAPDEINCGMEEKLLQEIQITLEEENREGELHTSTEVSTRKYENLESKSENKQLLEPPSSTPPITQDRIVMEPYHYITSLPAKGARDKLIDALNTWYHVPKESLATIRSVVRYIHEASLMLDDIQDNSPVRRGHPATHIIFGTAQTINSATYMVAKCIEEVTDLSNEAMKGFAYEFAQLNIGQGHDLHWTFHCKVPTIEEYYTQTEQKTGGLFRMVSKLMRAEATQKTQVNADALMTLLGRYYQIRDDYQDISSTDTENSTIYDDLDGGSFTLPIIHAINHQSSQNLTEIFSILQSRKQQGKMSLDMKKLVLKRLNESGSLGYTRDVLVDLHEDLGCKLVELEKEMGIENWILRMVLHRLKI